MTSASRVERAMRAIEGQRAQGGASLAAWLVYGLTALSIAALYVSVSPQGRAREMVLAIGLIAVWRYSWQLVHLGRAAVYQWRAFPHMRAAAMALPPESARPSHLYVLITTYKMAPETVLRSYEALFRELIRYGAPTTILASVTDQDEEMFVAGILGRMNCNAPIELMLMKQSGLGKRDAMAEGMRAISRTLPPPGALTILMDGDTILPRGLLSRCLPYFGLKPRLGALTTRNVLPHPPQSFEQTWFDMRFAMRHLYMSSMSLSSRVLCLTGRFSVFRTAITVDPTFIEALERDHLEHWRLGRVQFLTGDDKSTWFQLLKNGWEMLYIPDAEVICIEEMPKGGFVKASTRLMMRWYGNMLRNNGRALKLGPRVTGLFTWICLLDQRLNIWTSLTGPTFAVLIGYFFHPAAFLAYIVWVMLSRVAYTANIRVQGGSFSAFTPLLLYYQQVVGGIVKVYLMFHLDQQSWTRQGITAASAADALPARRIFSHFLTVVAVAVFLYAAALVAGVSRLP